MVLTTSSLLVIMKPKLSGSAVFVASIKIMPLLHSIFNQVNVPREWGVTVQGEQSSYFSRRCVYIGCGDMTMTAAAVLKTF